MIRSEAFHLDAWVLFFLADENMPLNVATVLRLRDHEVRFVQEFEFRFSYKSHFRRNYPERQPRPHLFLGTEQTCPVKSYRLRWYESLYYSRRQR
jgi:hypothetical protein